jgi:hypothetical protein
MKSVHTALSEQSRKTELVAALNLPLSSVIELELLAGVEAMCLEVDEPGAAAKFARRWQAQFEIAQAHSEHRSAIGSVGDEHDVSQVDQYWFQEPLVMLERRRALEQLTPEQLATRAVLLERIGRGELSAEEFASLQ